MFTMGSDFKYQYAQTWFRQMDKLVHYVNKDGRVNALYSTPSFYTDAKHAANEFWPLKTQDFFPYADRANAYWTGYFTSRPSLKGFIRSLSAYYLVATQLEFFKGRNHLQSETDTLADALAVAQHHDAITGTAKQHVADDYTKRLSLGYAEAEKLVGHTLACLVESKYDQDCQNPTTKFEQCPLMNITYCPPSEVGISQGKSLVVLVYNSLGWKRNDVIRIPIFNDQVKILNSEGKEIEAQLLPIANASLNLRDKYAKIYTGKLTNLDHRPRYWLVFTVSVPPLGFSTYFILNEEGKGSKLVISTLNSLNTPQSESNKVEVGQGSLKLIFGKDRQLQQFLNSKKNVNESIELAYSYYSGDDGSSSDVQASGAYVFRPNGEFPFNTSKQTHGICRGPILEEIHQSICPWIYQITRVYKGKEHAEIEFIVGPIPVNDDVGKEVVAKITTTMLTKKTFYTDSNGRDFIKRVRDFRSDWNLKVNQPVAGNYYPINLGIYIEDERRELSVLVDRPLGGSSIKDGQIELMLHRKLLSDDSRGVEEALDEVVCEDCDESKCTGLMIQGKFYLRIDPLGQGAKWRRTMGQEIYSPLLLAFSEEQYYRKK